MTSDDILSLLLLGWTVLFLLFLNYQSLLQIFDFFKSSPLNFVWCSFYRNLVHVSWIFFLTTHDQYQPNVLILLIVTGSYIIGLFLSLFILWIISEDHNHMCIQTLFHRHFFKSALISFGMLWGIFGLFLHWSKNVVGNSFVASKYEFSITLYIGLQKCYFSLAIFSTSAFIFSWYSKVFFSSYIVTTI